MNDSNELSSLVQAAISIESAAERGDFINTSCGDNRGLMGRLQMILDSLPAAEVARARLKAKTPPHHSVLHSLAGTDNQVPQICLDDSIEGTQTPVVQLSSDESPKLGDSSRYQLQGEIARGGMGAILKGRDTDLGRNLAVKVLLETHKDNELAIQRFVEEAQIAGQLQHPGIAPVYELGRFEDRRPFFTMKLVTGETLAWMLMTRRTPQQDRAKLLGIFEQVCHTMAYAHSRRVMHRDLKPANIMVGAFGEVQVMDWGLAKVLPKEGRHADRGNAVDPRKDQSLIQTIRSADGRDLFSFQGTSTSGSTGADTQMGSALGTPAYMPPEQALGEVDRMDRRADVFGLGAILCEILTGEPPYVADTTTEILRMAARARLDACMKRLDTCGADKALIDLTKRCLSEEAGDRPADASVLAKEISAHLHSVEDKLRQTRIRQAQDAARTAEERKRRRVALALAASILLMLCLGAGVWMRIQAQRRTQAVAANEQLDSAVTRARLHQGLANDQSLELQHAELAKALISAQQAVALSQQVGVKLKKRNEVNELLAGLRQDAKQVDSQLREQNRNDQFLDRLDVIRVSHADGGKKLDVARQRETLAATRTTLRYGELFQTVDFDVDRLTIKGAAGRIRQSAISEELIAALDAWASTISVRTPATHLRVALAEGDWRSAVYFAKVLLMQQPESSYHHLALSPLLILSGDLEGYQRHLKEMEKRFDGTENHRESGHVVKSYTLLANSVELKPTAARALERALDNGEVEQALMFKWGKRGMLEYRRGNADRAIDFAKKALEQNGPETAKAYALLVQAMAQHRLRNVDGAKQTLERASELVNRLLVDVKTRASFDTPIAVLLLQEASSLIHPDAPGIDIGRVYAGYSKRMSVEAMARFRLRDRLMQIANAADNSEWRRSLRNAIASGDVEAIIKAAEDPSIHKESVEMIVWLAQSLYRGKRYETAVSILEEALSRQPKDFWLNYELSRSLAKLDRTDESLGYARAALAIQPKSSAATWMIVANLHDAGQSEESIEVFGQWLAESEMDIEELISLSGDLRQRGRFAHAESVARKAIESDPTSPTAYQSLAYVLNELARHDEEIVAARKAVELASDDRDMNFRLAYALRSAGELEKSIDAYRRVLEIDPQYAAAYNNLGGALREAGDFEAAAAMHRTALRLMPRSHRYHQNLILSLVALANEKGHPRTLRDEIVTLRNRRPGLQDRIAEYRRKLELNPRDEQTRRYLVQRLLECGQYDDAEEQCRILLESDPNNGQTHVLLARVLHSQDDMEWAIKHYRTATQLAPDVWITHLSFAVAAHTYAIGNRLPNFAASRYLSPPTFHPDDLQLTADNAALLDEAISAYQRFLALSEPMTDSPNAHSSVASSNSKPAEFPPLTSAIARPVPAALTLALRARGREKEAQKVETDQDLAFETWNPRNRPVIETIQQVAALKRRGELDKAVRVLQLFLAKHKEVDLIATLLGRTLGQLGRIEEAEEVLESLIGQNPHADSGYVELGKLYAFREPRRPEEAIEVLDRGIAAGLGEPQTAFLHMMKGSVYLSEQRLEQAFDSYNKALTLNPRMGLAFSGIGEIHMRQGNVDQAIEAHRQSVQLSPRDGTCHHSYAQTLISIVDDQGNYPHLEEALKHALQAIDTFRFSPLAEPPPSSWLYTVGLIYYRQGEFVRAKQYLHNALEDGPRSASHTALLAMVHWQLGDHQEARALIKQLPNDLKDLRDDEQRLLSEATRLITP